MAIARKKTAEDWANSWFNPAAIDDYGFTPDEYRVLARIRRRGLCEESFVNMAKTLKIDERIIRRIVALLSATKIVTREKRSGRTDVLMVNPFTSWPSPGTFAKARTTDKNAGSKSATGRNDSEPPTKLTVVPPTKVHDEGIPERVSLKGYSECKKCRGIGFIDSHPNNPELVPGRTLTPCPDCEAVDL
jgi:hypothetical protein